MNSVERVKQILKERKIPVSRLEKDLNYSNGYIGQLRKGVFPDDRLLQIAEYLGVSVEYLIGNEQKEMPLTDSEELNEYLEILRTRPEMRMLFSTSKCCTKEEVMQAVKVIEAIRKP